MIHAYLFITDGNDDHDGHGPAFHEHMYRINKEAGTKISVYHNFHDEVHKKQIWVNPLIQLKCLTRSRCIKHTGGNAMDRVSTKNLFTEWSKGP